MRPDFIRGRRLITLLSVCLLTMSFAMPEIVEARRGGGFGGFSRRSSRSFSFSRHSTSRTSRSRRSRSDSRARATNRTHQQFDSRSGRRMPVRTTRNASQVSRTNRNVRQQINSSGRSNLRPSNRIERSRRHNTPRNITVNNNYYGGGRFGWGMHSFGIWDLFFLNWMMNSHRGFYYHRMNQGELNRLERDKVFQQSQIDQLKAEMASMKASGVARNENYLPKDVDPDIPFSQNYVESQASEIYGAEAAREVAALDRKRAARGATDVWKYLFYMCLAGWGMWFVFIRRA